MLNIVIPMAGNGSRFRREGYVLPKPLIPVHDVPMIELVINNIRPKQEHRFIFICRSEHLNEYGLAERLQTWAPGSEVITVDHVTDGAACTVLAARHLIDNDQGLMIANSDQYVDCDIDKYLAEIYGFSGLIMTMEADDPKWSYVAFDENAPDRRVARVIEKEVISSSATVGIYNFSRGRDFVASADKMIRSNDRSGGEFYVAPAYNYLIEEDGAAITTCNIGSEGHGMYGLGIPSDLSAFLKNPISLKAVAACRS